MDMTTRSPRTCGTHREARQCLQRITTRITTIGTFLAGTGPKAGVAMENLEGFGGVKWVKAFENMGVMLKLGQGL